MWKSKYFSGLAVIAGLTLAGDAHAVTVYFEFTGNTVLPGIGPQSPHPGPYLQQIPGTVTGHITGLVDNATSSASGIFLDSAPSALAVNYSLNLVDTVFLYKNSFQLNAGVVEKYDYESGGPANSNIAGLTISQSAQVTLGAPIRFAGLATEVGNELLGVVSEDPVSFSSAPFSVSSIPLPAALPMFGVTLLGLIGFGIKRKEARDASLLLDRQLKPGFRRTRVT